MIGGGGTQARGDECCEGFCNRFYGGERRGKQPPLKLIFACHVFFGRGEKSLIVRGEMPAAERLLFASLSLSLRLVRSLAPSGLVAEQCVRTKKPVWLLRGTPQSQTPGRVEREEKKDAADGRTRR